MWYMQSQCPSTVRSATWLLIVPVPQTGATARARASAAPSHQLMPPPPEMPVTPIASASTSGLSASRSSARIPFQHSTPAGE